MIKLDQIIQNNAEIFQLKIGSLQQEIAGIRTPENADNNSLIFVSQSQQENHLSQSQNSTWIFTEKVWEGAKDTLTSMAQKMNSSVVTCRNIQLAMATLLPAFDPRPSLLSFPEGISPHAWVDPSALIGTKVRIGPFTCIGPGVKIGEGTIIGPHCTIEGGVEIGNDCYLESHIFVGRQSRLGKECRLKPFASIGADGYGYAPGDKGPKKIPQLGIVVLEDQVDVGSGTCVDRATLTETRIGKGTKLDNLVHIAHNCNVGKYCFITAGFAMAGSSTIGDFFMTGGTSAVADHVTIAPKVTLAGASVVTSSIPESGAYGGNPLQPMQDYLRTRSSVGQLSKLRKQIQRILKHLGLDEA